MDCYKIVVYVCSILFILFAIGSCTTTDFRWCAGSPLGFSCDAWVQALSQLAGGAATLAAVLITLRSGHAKEVEQSKKRLLAIADEFGAAASTFIKIAHGIRRFEPDSDQTATLTLRLVQEFAEPVHLRVYSLHCSEIVGLGNESFVAVMDAVEVIDRWNRIENPDRPLPWHNWQEALESIALNNATACRVASESVRRDVGPDWQKRFREA